jgi:hypothetical protein
VAHLRRRLGNAAQARAAYEQALALTRQEPERRFLERRLARAAGLTGSKILRGSCRFPNPPNDYMAETANSPQPGGTHKEQLDGILILEANDLNHAIQLMSKHPGVKAGPFEIRPAADLTEMIRESEQRRAAAH